MPLAEICGKYGADMLITIDKFRSWYFSAWSDKTAFNEAEARRARRVFGIFDQDNNNMISETEFQMMFQYQSPRGYIFRSMLLSWLNPVAYSGKTVKDSAGCSWIPVRHRGMGTGISEASKRVPIFSFATQGGKQASSYF